MDIFDQGSSFGFARSQERKQKRIMAISFTIALFLATAVLIHYYFIGQYYGM